jgi:hypothetical protein
MPGSNIFGTIIDWSVTMLNIGNIGSMGDAITNYIKTQEGQEKITKYLGSPEGMTMLKNFAETPDGKKVILSILPQLLEGLNLPPQIKDAIKSAIPV